MRLIDFGSEFSDLLIKHSGLRFGAGTKNSKGRFEAGTSTLFTFKGTTPQPANQDDMNMLTEGTDVQSSLVLHSVHKLNVVEGDKKADIVIWEGANYLVMQSNRRNNLGGYYRNLIIKVQAGE